MSLNYQIQPSSLAPAGVTVPYGRYNIVVGEAIQVVVTASINTIADALKEGHTVTFVDSEGVNIGHLMPTLSGGFVLSEAPIPLAEQLMLGFRPYKELLKMVRFDPSFSRVNSTYRTPIITSVNSWYQNELNTGYVVNGDMSALVVIEGSNLKMLSTTFHIDLLIGIVNFPNVCHESGIISWTDNKLTYLEKMAVVAVEATGTLSYYVGDRMVQLEVPIVDKS